MPSKTGWRRRRSRRFTSLRVVRGNRAKRDGLPQAARRARRSRGKTGILKAFTKSCVMNASTANSSAASWRPESSSRPGGSNTTSHGRTARSAIKRRGSSRGAATLGSGRPPGSQRPELPSTPKPTTNNNQQNFRSELSHLRGQANTVSVLHGFYGFYTAELSLNTV
jgi:hypothetical protein